MSRKIFHLQSLRIGVVFYSQTYQCTDCTVNALNNLLQRPKDKKITEEMMLSLRRTNRRGRQVPVAEKGEKGGLFVDWPKMLEIILPQCQVIPGAGVAVQYVTADDMTYGFIANIKQDAKGHINHAVAVVRLQDKKFYLFDSLTGGPQLLDEENSKKLSIMAIVSRCRDISNV